MRSSLNVLVLVAVAVGLLWAAAPAQAGKKDNEFARGLLKRKWYDMAEKVFKKMASDGETDEERRQGELGQIEVLKNRAEDEQDPEKKKDLFEDAIKRYKDFLAGSSDINAQFNLAELLKSKGKDFTALAQESEDPKEKKSLQDEAQKAFTEAVALITAFVNKMKDVVMKKDGIENLTIEEKDQLQRGSFYHAELHYEMAKIYEGSADKKNQLLLKAIELFDEFLWDWEEYVSAFHAYIKKGLCYLEMGQFERAIESYRSVMGIDTEGAPQAMVRIAAVLRMKAYYRIMEALNQAGKHDMALSVAAEMEETFAKIIEDESINPHDGRLAMMEKAKAYAGKGEYSSAIQTVMPIVKLRGYHARLAVKLLSEWGSRDPTATVEVLFLQGEGLMQSGELGKAVEAYEETIARLNSKAERDAYASRTWHQMGMAYAFQRRYYEAGLAFAEGERVWDTQRKLKPGEEDWGSACAYRAYSAFKKQHGVIKTDFLKDLYSEKRLLLTTKYPESKYAKNLQFFAAQDKMRDGDFLDAVQLFDAVDKISEYYEDAQSRIGRCYFGEYEKLKKEHEATLKKANPDKYAELKASGELKPPANALKYLADAEKKLHEYVQLTKDTPAEGLDHKNRRKKSLAITQYYLGRVYDEKGQADDVLKHLDEFENKYKDVPDMVLPAAFLKLRAHYGKKNGRGVEDMLRVIKSVDDQLRAKQKRKKVHIFLLIGWQLAGKLFSELANKAKMDGEVELGREYSSKAAVNLKKWVDNDPSIDKTRLDAVGIRLFKAKKYEDAAMIYETILRSFGDQLDPRAKKESQIKLGDCYVALKKWQEAKKVFLEMVFDSYAKELLKDQAFDPESGDVPSFVEKRLFVAEENKMPLIAKMSVNMVYIEKLVGIYNSYGDKLRKDRNEKLANQMWDFALMLYGKLIKPPRPNERAWWESKANVWKIMVKKGLFKDVVEQIKKIKIMYPELGGRKTAKIIKDLEDQAKEKAR